MATNNNYGNWQFYANASGVENGIISDNLNVADEKDGLHIRVSMFFDGTLNNMYNTEARIEYDKKNKGEEYKEEEAAVYEKRLNDGDSGDDEEDSYANDYSNVVRLFHHYLEDTSDSNTRTAAVYIEGIATFKYKDDSTFWGGAMGAGDAGIPTRVREGCEQMAEMVSDIAKDDKVAKLTIDVFGFSRGAAAARHFLHEVNKKKVEAHQEIITTTYGTQVVQIPEAPAHGYLGFHLNDKNVKLEDSFELNICFAGLFDTVASYWRYKDKGAKVLSLDAVEKAEHILHLTALDERRTNFSLNRIPFSKSRFEKDIPGVHCDVGGCYNDKLYEAEDKMVFVGSKKDAKAEIKYLIEDGWYKQGDLDTYLNPLYLGYCARTTRTKYLLNHYSFITLHIMKKKATGKFVSLKFKSLIDDKYKLPTEREKDLYYTNQRLNDYVFKNANPMEYHTPDEMVEMIRQTVNREKLEVIIADLKERQERELLKEFFPSVEHSLTESKSDPISTNSSSSRVFDIPQLSQQRDAIRDYIQDLPQMEFKPDEEQEVNRLLKDYLDAGYYKDYPELQEKIKDHNAYKFLRYNYFHKSYRWEFVVDRIAYNPFKASVREMPSRNIITG